METFPQDLLIGVCPLVFAVNAITATDNDTSADDEPVRRSPRRSLFDRFLDAVAASLVDDDASSKIDNVAEPRRSSLSLFRPDEDDSSDEEDMEILAKSLPKKKSSAGGFYAGFGRRPVPPGGSNSNDDSNINTRMYDKANVSYAKALQNGQGFFQRARIESVSTHHGLPPCKDPDGTDNLASSMASFVKNRDIKLAKLLVQSYPLTGILTAGWLEKHAHALPSVILVVCTVCENQKAQDIVDQRLLATIHHFDDSLTPKRQCTVHVVGLMTDDVTIMQGEEWARTISGRMMDLESGSSDLFRVALLRSSFDLDGRETGAPTSRPLRELHQSVKDASMQYYLGQARRTKEKLAQLLAFARHDKLRVSQETPPHPLLPLIIRYCFKVAIFYEFQWKHEKSLRYMAEAYRHAANYYGYLLYLREHPAVHDDVGDESANSVSISGGDELEVSLKSSNDMSFHEIWTQVVPPPPDDMIHQCRAIAEWLNLKLLHAGFSSHTEGGLIAANTQWRQHCRLFCTRRDHPLFPSNEWYEWSFIARNWMAMSELVERHPPKALGDLGNEYDEVLLRCSPWRAYESTMEATLKLWKAVQMKQASGELPGSHDVADPMRARYVGGCGTEGLRMELHTLQQSDLRGKCMVRL
jgi:hypothetical protein